MDSGAAILGFVESRRSEFEEAHLVTALHRLAKSRDGHALLGNAVLRDLIRSLHFRVQSADAADAADASANATGSLRAVMTPRHLANTVWALARLSANEVQLTKDIVRVAATQLREFKPQELASTIWG